MTFLRGLPRSSWISIRDTSSHLGSGLIDQSQKMMAAAMEMADMKVWAQRS